MNWTRIFVIQEKDERDSKRLAFPNHYIIPQQVLSSSRGTGDTTYRIEYWMGI